MRVSKLVMGATVGVCMMLGLLGLHVTPSQADDKMRVEWQTLIGIIQASNLVGSGTGQVTGGGQPWSTTGGYARVDLDEGEIQFEVHGLVHAGGNAIGVPNPQNQVKGTLVCDTNGSAGGGNSTLVDTPLVPLDAQGNAEFKGNVGPLPAACVDEPDIAFLIRLVNQRWVANGAVRVP
jgi:hypothetical protein